MTAVKSNAKADTQAFPFAAFQAGSKEWEQASMQFLANWKQQVDTALRLVDTAVQGSLEMRSSQLAAAMETHARDIDAERSVMSAKSAADLLAIQLSWMTSNLEKSIAYWNQMLQAAADANGKLVGCLRGKTRDTDASQPAKPG